MPHPPLPSLPIEPLLPALKTALASGHAVLAAPPGSGKTTVVPLALLAEPWLAGKKILLLEPRRLAARAAAARMATLLEKPVGRTVGYQIRFERLIGPATRIEVLTEGILTRRLQSDASLDDTGLIIFDEFHERSMHADLALALCLDLCQLREDLRLLVMSATLDTAPLARLLGDAPVLTGEGRPYPTHIDYLDREPRGRIAAIAAAGIRRVLREQSGDILAFFPGTGEIRETRDLLADSPDCAGLVLAPLYGDLSRQDQDRAIMPDADGRRRIILATSIAETSLTIEGVRCVVDCGWSRLPAFDPGCGLSRLTTVRVAKAAADQRAGRAGRLGPGYCLRLWTRAMHHSLPPFHPPEILNVDLAGLALELAAWGVAAPEELRWLDPPRPGPFRQAQDLLRSLGALDAAGRITAVGRQLASLPVHPRLGHLLLVGQEGGQTALACDLAALLSERDPLRREAAGGASLETRLRLLDSWRQGGNAAALRDGGDPSSCRRIDQAARQWRRLVGSASGAFASDAIGSLLAAAYPDRIARRRPGQWGRYLLASGRGAALAPDDPLAAGEYLVIPHLDAGQGEGRIFMAEVVDIDTVRQDHGHLLTMREQVGWDEAQARVLAVRREALGEIVVAEQPLADADPEAVRAALLAGIRQMGLAALPWNREARQSQTRILCLRTWQPEVAWPDLSDEALMADLAWLAPYLGGMSTARHLDRLDLAAILTRLLDWKQQQRLQRNAPVTCTVPSGSRIRIDYQIDGPPILAVRLQELFGLAKTPTICNGRVPLLLHLLSPARRPIQVTADLAGFWQRGYAEVKKELRGRYPKHFWPDNPLAAEPARGVRRTRPPG
ncbi:ATP-dependent helicase HrpB [Desulfobulbus elongatus]|uniref:ATP-dependent helicase HrpB n=1 Tax=Desulfobulbus elongatus TaxID=53332 RepID=UPI00047F1B00|nr:ATP-dependent helicase HrpB [Desulfobulbus elongatus]